MGFFVSLPKIIESVVCAVCFTALLLGCFYRLGGILQSLGYSGAGLFKWTAKKGNLTFGKHVLLAMMCALSCAVISLCFSFAGTYSGVCGLAGFVIFFPLFIWSDNKIALKVPVAFTPRLKRLTAVLAVIIAVLAYFCITLLNYADACLESTLFTVLRYVPLAVFPLLIVPLLVLANLIDKAYEIPHNNGFVKKAKSKLVGSKIRVIGITGSYGKTSTKRILCDILSKKYRVLATPSSHNTPLGLALTINSNDLDGYDFLIAEMGARRIGDIAELCEMCPPELAVITGICPQHLETFGTEENIIKAKGEILLSCKTAVISQSFLPLFEAYPCAKSGSDCISNPVCTCEGSDFTLTLGGESVPAHTKLLGAHALENIAVASATAYALGMTAGEIASAIADVDYIEHRLQLIKSGGVNILDDGYNSNVKGAECALRVLRSFAGRKIVVTPGLVELGVLEERENYRLGEQLAGLDCVILVGETLVQPVKRGYLENGGDPEKLQVVLGLDNAQQKLKSVLQSGDTVLFLNDLPDIY